MKQPTLRFQQFRDNWKVKMINDLGTIGRGKSRHRPRNDTRLYGVEYPFVQTSDIRNAGLILNSFSQAYSEFGLNQSKLWPQGTLCITIAANIAETSILGIDACFPDSIIGFIPNSKISNVVFVKIYFEFINPSLQKLSEGVAQSNLNLEKLSSIEFTVPSLLEQQKIASFFMLINRKIEKQQEKIEKLKELKKGIMQKIFTQELRFKDENGGEFGDWEEKLLKYVFTKYTETIIVDDNTKYNQITISKTGNIQYRDSKLGSNIGRKRQFLINLKMYPNTLTFIRQGVFDGAIGFIPSNLDGSIVTENMPLLELNSLYNRDFISQYLKTDVYYERVIFPIKPTGSAQIALHEKEWLEQELAFPCFREQQKIADFLSVIDMKNEKEEVKLKVLKELKRGFMKQMFV